MEVVHEVVGFAVVGLFAAGWLWGGAAWIRRRSPGERYWRWLSIAQVVAIVQAAIGVVLLLLGRVLPTWLHLVYGLGPLAILGVAHALARDANFRERPWVPFSLAAFICFGLSLRALMTGLGIG
ncbi:MAG: hypothetical protein ACKO8G_03805 [Actinomycetota bacterium]